MNTVDQIKLLRDAVAALLSTQPFANDGITGVQQFVTEADVAACRKARKALSETLDVAPGEQRGIYGWVQNAENLSHFEPGPTMPEEWTRLDDVVPVYLGSERDLEDRNPDDVAIDTTAAEMKTRMKSMRGNGQSTWSDPACWTTDSLAETLVEQVHVGDPLDVIVTAMMLCRRGAVRGELMIALNEFVITNTRRPATIAARDFPPLPAGTEYDVNGESHHLFTDLDMRKYGQACGAIFGIMNASSDLETAMRATWTACSRLRSAGIEAPMPPKFIEWFSAGWDARSGAQTVAKNRELHYTEDGQLAECPCCGSIEVGGAYETVYCQTCGLSMHEAGKPLKAAILKWNRRSK